MFWARGPLCALLLMPVWVSLRHVDKGLPCSRLFPRRLLPEPAPAGAQHVFVDCLTDFVLVPSRAILQEVLDADLSDEAFPFSTHQLVRAAGHLVGTEGPLAPGCGRRQQPWGQDPGEGRCVPSGRSADFPEPLCAASPRGLRWSCPPAVWTREG